MTLHTIAADTTIRPAMRWRAARDLTTLGERGRQLGIPLLQAIVSDDALPVTSRVATARALGGARPDMRNEIVRLLRSLPTAEQPAARIQALDAIGQFGPNEGAIELSKLTEDRTLNPGARLRAAETMVKLHRDYRENAAVTAREIALEQTAPCHIRIKAARALARYSQLCRSEAQALLIRLCSDWSEKTDA